jgi:uncharacterized protein RhaS with RHS repeats
MQDPQLGRFFTQDRFAEKYLRFSPYGYAVNNPISYIDKNGDSLILSGKDDAIAMFKQITNNGLGGYYTVTENESGTYSLEATGKKGKLTAKQRALQCDEQRNDKQKRC